MKLSLSNLAWDISDNDQILTILKTKNIHNIEGVLTKINEWDKLSNDVLIEYKKKLDSYNIKMESIQSIFYDVKCDGIKDTKIVYKHIDRLIEICKILGVKVMVFGSPTIRNGIVDDSLSKIFKRIDNSLNNTGITLTIEPNSKVYGGNYFYNIYFK